MYLHTKAGFVEADAWDGSPVPNKTHMAELQAAAARCTGHEAVIVVRSRYKETILDLLAAAFKGKADVLASPEDWDYEFRCYLTASEYASVLVAVAMGLDYRNFKTWCAHHQGGKQHKLAHDIWHAAHADGHRRQSALSDPSLLDGRVRSARRAPTLAEDEFHPPAAADMVAINEALAAGKVKTKPARKPRRGQ